ncbi:3'-5' exoribonuclease YhaM family protein [Spiroplasma endosymbiont of Aspidapion aeneum]|uniref:3'-5' exoribonuclease YhaM family protein n=1 Tax=Spiroplasma endosymbiont of Aspidapion aeneum TaxID=3066276 RepID=UPI00313C61BF
MISIKDINQDIKTVQILVRCDKVLSNISNNGSSYMAIHLVDPTGRIEARLWNSSKSDEGAFIVDNLYLVEGNVVIYKNILQLKINNYKVVSNDELKNFGIKEDDFFHKANIDIEKEYKFIIDLVSKFKNKTYSIITLELLKNNENKYKTYPAAMTIHHNVIGGLLWHSVSLLKAAIALQPVYEYCDVDWELVYAGTILHDIGKVIEMNSKRATNYTLAGKLMGHISIGNALVEEMAKKFQFNLSSESYEDVIRLQHVILSSHGKYEFGSPVEPQLLEAIIVSSLDLLDSSINHIDSELKKIDIGNFTQRIIYQNNRMFFSHYKKNK